jgi:HTH-type transcriptional regulator / antitoxin HigA
MPASATPTRWKRGGTTQRGTTKPAHLLASWDTFYGAAGDVLKPITSEADYLAKLELVDRLWDETYGEDDPRRELVRWLLRNIADWEQVHEAPYFHEVPGHLVLKSLMEEHGVSQRQLETEGLMQQSLASKILRGERGISKTLAKRLGERFHTSPAVFI